MQALRAARDVCEPFLLTVVEGRVKLLGHAQRLVQVVQLRADRRPRARWVRWNGRQGERLALPARQEVHIQRDEPRGDQLGAQGASQQRLVLGSVGVCFQRLHVPLELAAALLFGLALAHVRTPPERSAGCHWGTGNTGRPEGP